jgi:predicted transposase YbfD/YdcC
MPYTVKKTLNKIVSGGNHYLVKVKGNQPKLKLAIEETIISNDPIGCHVEEAVTRGRLEIRETYLYARHDNLDKGWESIKLIVYVHRYFLSKRKEHKTDSLYVSDLQTNDAKYIAEGVRSHWYIENKLHYTKDVTMREDKECTSNKTAAANLALFRNFAFNILKTKNKSIKLATEICANYSLKQLLKIMRRT